MDSLVQQARGALLDQRTLQPRFREAQLDVLFSEHTETDGSHRASTNRSGPARVPGCSQEYFKRMAKT